MKKASKQLLAIGAVLSLGLVISTMPASATISKPAPEKPGKPSSDGETKDTNTEIEVELQKSNVGITLGEAPLINFSSAKLTSGRINLTANSINGKIRVLNPGDEDGYKVGASISKFKDKNSVTSETTPERLKGAKFTVKNPTVTPEDSDNPSLAPKAKGDIELNGNIQNVMTADKNAGLGIFNLKYKDATLQIPDGNKAGAYTATVTWTLNNVPA